MHISLLVWALTALVIGIAFAPALPLLAPILVILLACIGSAGAIFYRARPIISLVCILFLSLVMGVCIAQFHGRAKADDISHFTNATPQYYQGIVSAEPETRFENSVTYPLLISQTEGNQSVSGTVQVRQTSKVNTIPHAGDQVRVQGVINLPSGATNPGGFDYRAYLWRHGITATMTARHSNDITIVSAPHGFSLIAIAANIRRTLLAMIARSSLSPDDAALVSGILLSERECIPVYINNALERTGAIHILSVSGLHLTILAALLATLSRFLPPKRIIRNCANLIAIALIWLFALAAGLSTATMRSAVMTTVFLFAPIVRRDAEPLHSLVVAAYILLLFDPLAIYDVGAQLSFSCVGGILLWVTPLTQLLLPPERELSRFNRYVRSALLVLLVGVVAQVAAAPLTAYHFSFVSLIAPIANLIIVPVSEGILLIGLALSLLGSLIPLATFFWVPLHWLCLMLQGAGNLFAAPTFAGIAIPQPPFAAVILFYALMVPIGLFFRHTVLQRTFFPNAHRERSLWKIITLPVVALIVLPLIVLLPQTLALYWNRVYGKTLRVTFLDVGQGDSTVIEIPGGKVVVIDGGGHPGTDERYGTDPGNRTVVPFLRRRGINHVDLLVPTHPDEDHVQGLIAVVARIRVHHVLDSGIPDSGKDACTRLRTLIQRQQIPTTIAHRGQTISFKPAMIEVLHPTEPLLSGTRSDTNANSIVLRLHYGSAAVLLTGDADTAAEEDMLHNRLELRADVLKVGHHGSRFSSGEAFLGAVQPHAAVISVGRTNNFGHPTQEVLSRLGSLNATIYRTDQQGGITLKTDGKQIWIDDMHP